MARIVERNLEPGKPDRENMEMRDGKMEKSMFHLPIEICHLRLPKIESDNFD